MRTTESDEKLKKVAGNQEKAKNTETQMNAKQQEEAVKIITQHNPNNAYLDLAKRSLTMVPQELFILTHIQHLYLEENILHELQENFFDLLPALQWLDLRNNKLTSIPSSIGRHQCIKHLLLEGNKLTHLPVQMGMTKSLNGLNLRGNPLLSPPQHIVDQGVYVILSYLYQELQNRSKTNHEQAMPAVEKLNLADDTASSTDEELLTDAINFTDRNIPSPMSDDFDLVRHRPTPMSAFLHKTPPYQSLKGMQTSNSLLAGLRSKSNKGGKELSLSELQQQEGMHREQLRSMKERQGAQVEQRRKNEVALEEWRKEARRRQRLMSRSKTEVNLKPPPYGTDDQQLQFHSDVREEKVERVLPSEESNSAENAVNERQQVRRSSQEGDGRKQKASEQSETRQEEDPVCSREKRRKGEKTKKELEIQMRMKQHSSDLHDRLKKLRDDELAATASHQQSRELQRQLLEEKMSRDSELEYRFRAFTGDSTSINSSSKTDSV